jgi:DNA-binding XRE family transcriptional regulator
MSKPKESTAERLKYLREKVLGMNQTDFATAAGVSHRSVSNIESGEEAPRATNDIIAALRVNEAWLRSGKGEIWIDGNTEENVARIKAGNKTVSLANPWEVEAYKQLQARLEAAERDKDRLQSWVDRLINSGTNFRKALASTSTRMSA